MGEKMVPNQEAWELRQLAPGTELLVTDANKRPVARGILREDRKSLSGPNGEFFPLDQWQEGWTLTILRQRRSNPRGMKEF